VEVGLSEDPEIDKHEVFSGRPCPAIVVTDDVNVNYEVKSEKVEPEQTSFITEINDNESDEEIIDEDGSASLVEVQSVTDSMTQPAIKPALTTEISKRYYPGDVVVKVIAGNVSSKEWQPFFGTVLKPAPGTEMEKSPDKGSSEDFHVKWDYSRRFVLLWLVA